MAHGASVSGNDGGLSARRSFHFETARPVDEASRGYPWHGIVGDVESRNPLTNDTVKLFLPWMQVVREELAHGLAPLWNRYSFSGYPLLANGESAPFSPLFLATLFVPLPKQIVAMAAPKIFAALVFTFLFLKREQASDAAATFGAVVFAFSTVMTVFLYYSTASVVAFLPAAAFALLNAATFQICGAGETLDVAALRLHWERSIPHGSRRRLHKFRHSAATSIYRSTHPIARSL